MFQRNQELNLHYPSSTLIGAKLDFQPRKWIVRFARDLTTDPLTIDDYFRRPLIYRGRWLIGVRDLETNEYKTIYPTTSREHFEELPLRIGLYEAFGQPPVDVISREFDPSIRERMLLAKTLFNLSELDLGDLKLGVFAEDLRVTDEEAGQAL